MGFDLAGVEGGPEFPGLAVSDGGGAEPTISIAATSEIPTAVLGVTEDLPAIDDVTIIV